MSTVYLLRVSHSFQGSPTFANAPGLIVSTVCPRSLRSIQTMPRSATEGFISVGDIVPLRNNAPLVLCSIEGPNKALMLSPETILPYQEEQNTNPLCTDCHARCPWNLTKGCCLLLPLRVYLTLRPAGFQCDTKTKSSASIAPLAAISASG